MVHRLFRFVALPSFESESILCYCNSLSSTKMTLNKYNVPFTTNTIPILSLENNHSTACNTRLQSLPHKCLLSFLSNNIRYNEEMSTDVDMNMTWAKKKNLIHYRFYMRTEIILLKPHYVTRNRFV